jgi:hypothetical protein
LSLQQHSQQLELCIWQLTHSIDAFSCCGWPWAEYAELLNLTSFCVLMVAVPQAPEAAPSSSDKPVKRQRGGANAPAASAAKVRPVRWNLSGIAYAHHF